MAGRRQNASSQVQQRAKRRSPLRGEILSQQSNRKHQRKPGWVPNSVGQKSRWVLEKTERGDSGKIWPEENSPPGIELSTPLSCYSLWHHRLDLGGQKKDTSRISLDPDHLLLHYYACPVICRTSLSYSGLTYGYYISNLWFLQNSS